MRRGKWKLIQEKYKTLLFNLDDDPREQRNLASSRKDILRQLKSLLNEKASTIVPANKKPLIKDGSNSDKKGFVRTGWCKA